MQSAEQKKTCRAGEPETEKLVRPVRWEGHRNLTWQQEKALGPYPHHGDLGLWGVALPGHRVNLTVG